MKILLVGGGAREHALGESLCTDQSTRLYVTAADLNPGLARLAREYAQLHERDTSAIVGWASQRGVDLAVIGPEDPLDAGLADALWEAGIPTVGPKLAAARVETSKLFTRELMRRYDIPGGVDYHFFTDPVRCEQFLRETGSDWALKPVGLTGGKGVKVMGVQLHSREEAIQYGHHVIGERIGGTAGLLLEERLFGEEFTLQALVDGQHVVPLPLVKDYKLAFEGDRGPNTGSMGSYSCGDGLLPFLNETDRRHAARILEQIVHALWAERIEYQGVLYGQFIMTAAGVRLVEINARFGDPEALNVLSVLEGSFADVCQAIVNRRLAGVDIRFHNRASVCKYLTPPGYGVMPRAGVLLRINESAIERLGVRILFGRVALHGDGFLTTTSRAIALLSISETVAEAGAAVEEALQFVEGEYHIRHDIGNLAGALSRLR